MKINRPISNRRSRGALRFPGPLLMLFPLVTVGITVAWLQGRPASGGSFPKAPEIADGAGRPTWVGHRAQEGGVLGFDVELAPLHRDVAYQEFEAKVLQDRFGFPEGQPWRVELTAHGDNSRPLDLSKLSFVGAGGLIQAAPKSSSTGLQDPARVLFEAPLRLEAGNHRRFVLWGSSPTTDLKLVGLGIEVPLTLGPVPDPTGHLLAGGTAGNHSQTSKSPKQAPEGWETDKAELELEVLRLTGELENALADRVAREEEYVAWSELITGLLPITAPPEMYSVMGRQAPAPEPVSEGKVDAVAELKRERSREVLTTLRALLVVERLDSFDLLEIGQVELGFTGPVVIRQLDERGRPIGSLNADRLRLEGSRTARTLTLVLEDGYERRGGESFPFEGTQPGEERGGVRRFFMQNTDPVAWFQGLPELFGEQTMDRLPDDGLWQLFLVKRRLNEMLRVDAALGSYRIVSLAGVQEGQLRGVELEQLDRDGGLQKRLFADSLSLRKEPRGMLMVLEDGIQVQGGRKLAFLDGRYRIYLPTADQVEWTACGLPGLMEPKTSPLSARANR